MEKFKSYEKLWELKMRLTVGEELTQLLYNYIIVGSVYTITSREHSYA